MDKLDKDLFICPLNVALEPLDMAEKFLKTTSLLRKYWELSNYSFIIALIKSNERGFCEFH
jgi:hypothetical protein